MPIQPNDLIVDHIALQSRPVYRVRVFCRKCPTTPTLLWFDVPQDLALELFPDELAFKAEVIRYTIVTHPNHFHRP